jgi:hypothetical protein
MDLDELLFKLLEEADNADVEMRSDLAELLRGAAVQLHRMRNRLKVADLPATEDIMVA